MPKVALYNMSGDQVGELELKDSVFGIEPNEAVMHSFVKMQLANKRAGTASTKGRSEVRGGGRKPWRQKGTGRARVGTIRSPLWKGGGVIFGPKPRDFGYRLPKKMRRLALKSALSSKCKNDYIIVVDELKLDEPKTKRMISILDALNAARKTLVVTSDRDPIVTKSANNLQGVKTLPADFINVYDLLHYDTLLITRDAISRVEEVFA